MYPGSLFILKEAEECSHELGHLLVCGWSGWNYLLVPSLIHLFVILNGEEKSMMGSSSLNPCRYSSSLFVPSKSLYAVPPKGALGYEAAPFTHIHLLYFISF